MISQIAGDFYGKNAKYPIKVIILSSHSILQRKMEDEKMESEKLAISNSMRRIYRNEIELLTPEADALFTTDGTYSALERTANAHRAYFERASSLLRKTVRAVQNEGTHIAIAPAVGGLCGLVEGLVHRDIINSVKRGLKYGAAMGASIRGAKHLVNMANPYVFKECYRKEISELFGPDKEFIEDPYEFLARYDSIKDLTAKDPAQLGRLYTLYGIEGGSSQRPRTYSQSRDQEIAIQLGGAAYAVMALVVNNIIRSDFLDYQVATGMGVVTGFVKQEAKDRFEKRLGRHAKDAVEPTIREMNDHTRKQVIGGLVKRWYGTQEGCDRR